MADTTAPDGPDAGRELRSWRDDRRRPEPDRYEFSWVGKRQAIDLAERPATGWLAPDRGRSVSFDETGNVFVAGENLEVLKLLAPAYDHRVKLIYIDPPYNTGNDFVYDDDFADPLGAYLELTGQADEAGNLLTARPETSGRFHSSWLSMMCPRLTLARRLLRDDGVLIVSIDDHEVHRLRLLLDEIFGEENHLAEIIWEKRSGPPNDRVIGSVHEYLLVYARSAAEATVNLLPRGEADVRRYVNRDDDPRGPWTAGDLSSNAKGGRHVPHLVYDIVNPRTGQCHAPPEGADWRFSAEKVERLIDDDRIYFGADDRGRPKYKRFLSEVRPGLTVPTIWRDLATNARARAEIKDVLGENAVFETPKPLALMKRVLEVGSDPGDLVMDFFAGSASFGHAVLEMNAEATRSRHFVLVQFPEPTRIRTARGWRETPAHRAGFATLADIGRERLARVSARLRAPREQTGDPRSCRDLGFRYFELGEPGPAGAGPSAEALAWTEALANGLDLSSSDGPPRGRPDRRDVESS